MTNAQRLAALATTRKQREFDHDFLASWEGCITWEDAPIGQPAVLPGEFVVEEEDVLAYNRALGETDPLFIDPGYAREHAPGGKILVIDYARHDDERMSEQQADVWLGFSAEELESFAEAAGLQHAHVTRVPTSFARVGVDAHLPCLTLLASRPKSVARARTRQTPQPITE